MLGRPLVAVNGGLPRKRQRLLDSLREIGNGAPIVVAKGLPGIPVERLPPEHQHLVRDELVDDAVDRRAADRGQVDLALDEVPDVPTRLAGNTESG